jgi:hypothetical protein
VLARGSLPPAGGVTEESGIALRRGEAYRRGGVSAWRRVGVAARVTGRVALLRDRR